MLRFMISGVGCFLLVMNVFAEAASLSGGNIKRGLIEEAIIDSEPEPGAQYNKGDILEGGSISSGTIISADFAKIPDNYSVDSGSVTSASKVELSDLKAKTVVISGAMIKGTNTVIPGDIKVDLSKAHVTKAIIDSLVLPLAALSATKSDNKNAIAQGSIAASKLLPGDLSGRVIILNQDDSQYKPFHKIKSDGSFNSEGEESYCGKGCVYLIKSDNSKELTVNIRGWKKHWYSPFLADENNGNENNENENNENENNKIESSGQDYAIAKDTQAMLNYGYDGWTWGALVVPYKWQLHDKSISGSASLGPYLGFQFGLSDGDFGVNVIPLVSFGITNITVQNQANSSATSSVMGFTIAVGAGFSMTKSQTSLQGGLVCGQDRAGSSTPTPYKYEGKWWCALELGYPFAQ